jgi:hypothetical protein
MERPTDADSEALKVPRKVKSMALLTVPLMVLPTVPRSVSPRVNLLERSRE